MRRKLVNLGSTHAHRFIGLTDMNQIKAILREIRLNVLQEVKGFAEIVHPNWLEGTGEGRGKIARTQELELFAATIIQISGDRMKT